MKKERRINEEINTNEEALADTVQERDGDKAQEDKTKKKKSGSASTVILVLIMLIGLGVFLYPAVSDWWNSMHASRAIAGYVDAVDEMSEAEKEAMIEAARLYNESLPEGVHFNLSDEEYAEYESILDVTGTGIMGYIQIPSIGVNLPVYHGVDEGVLQIAEMESTVLCPGTEDFQAPSCFPIWTSWMRETFLPLQCWTIRLPIWWIRYGSCFQRRRRSLAL